MQLDEVIDLASGHLRMLSRSDGMLGSHISTLRQGSYWVEYGGAA
ncbi:hypothetical protein PRECH8_27550 [Insulibacter thermoxylanivorax]|uniref:Uncharacterized protein n=1 Tax=Insulibacter thermoxylanivorax TaxID=2749268 RepID=A0A916QIF7_9BACL|nr:hypothetical protein [Insulibacter thermoxylanivorax]GFR39459.1 hypothetical protein PRECH8_27550 [Insulibacter thermoxylanivorax]